MGSKGTIMAHVIEAVSNFLGTPPEYGFGVAAGAAGALVVIAGAWLLRALRSRRSAARGITVSKEGGDVFIAVRAVREYVAILLGEYGELRLTGVTVRQGRNGVGVKLFLDVLPGTNVDQLTDGIRDRVTRMLTGQLGVHDAIRVDFVFDSSPTGQRRLNRAARKAGGTGRSAPGGESSQDSGSDEGSGSGPEPEAPRRPQVSPEEGGDA